MKKNLVLLPLLLLVLCTCSTQKENDAEEHFFAALQLEKSSPELAESFYKKAAKAAGNEALKKASEEKLLSYTQEKTGEESTIDDVERAVRLAASLSGEYRHRQALEEFRLVINQRPQVFIEQPDLIAALGRAFQYAGKDDEGINLMLAWANDSGNAAHAEARYLLLFYSGRIARARSLNKIPTAYSAETLFREAYELAPDAEQKDACIWYILDVSGTANMQSLLRYYIPQMHDISYFDDIFKRYCRTLTVQRNWTAMQEIYELLPPGKCASKAQYAYILSREFPTKPAFKSAIAREPEISALYYRIMAGFPVDLTANDANHANDIKKSPASFLLAFFKWNCAEYLQPYLDEYREELSIEELRAIAEGYYKLDLWEEALRVAVNYMARPDYTLDRQDFIYAYPEAYKEYVERYAAEYSLHPAILYGLLRTESYFAADAVSSAAAQGLAQLMPETALDMAGRIARAGGPDYRIKDSKGEWTAVDYHNPEASIHIGAYYLRYLRNRMENMMMALLAYNAGMGRVKRWRTAASDLPMDIFVETLDFEETREYGKRILSASAVYGSLYFGLSMEQIAADIYNDDYSKVEP
ncbi:MAG: lytic transglycosylase domain-containing protein [Spirochaetaceae bacterium]|jgi:soluble lytic murein transglycosylase|nr:lytic transglycosylase domain-containing protein [Spirochaetaceae bacterium]